MLICIRVKGVYVAFNGVDQFSSEGVDKYEEALLAAQKEGTRIRGLVLCHPHNPLGQCYPRETLIKLMQLCNKYKIHLIVDEIYALSVYDIEDPKAVRFESTLSLETEKYIHPDYHHVLYGMSKDIAASGIRLGCVYTRNVVLRQAMTGIGTFHWSGNLNEKAAIAMLEDEKWMDNYLRLSRERLAARNKLVRKILEDEGVAYHKGCNAGFFIWIDLRPFLSASPTSSLKARSAAQADLVKRMLKNKIFITDGDDMFAEEPGWFRVIFAQDERVLKEGMRR